VEWPCNRGCEKWGPDGPERSLPNTTWPAAKYGHIKELNKYLSGGAKIDSQDPYLGITPLPWAALNNQITAVEELLDKGAQLNAPNRDGARAMHCAAILGRDKTVQLLIKKGAELFPTNLRREFPLDSLKANWGSTFTIAGLLQIKEEKTAGQRHLESKTDLK
jgi:ankyrin repeat protein